METASSVSLPVLFNFALLRRMKVSWTYFTWGPNSQDTGGILEDDWHMARVDKLTALQPIMYPQFQCAPPSPNPHPPPLLVSTSGRFVVAASWARVAKNPRSSSTRAPTSSKRTRDIAECRAPGKGFSPGGSGEGAGMGGGRGAEEEGVELVPLLRGLGGA